MIQAPLSLWRAERGEGEEGALAAVCCPLGFMAWCQRPVRASMGLRPACFLPSSWSQEETPVGMQGPPEQREVAGIFLAARSPQCPPLGHGGTRRNRNALVGQPGTAPHTALQCALPGKTDLLPNRKPQGLWWPRPRRGRGVPAAWTLVIHQPPGPETTFSG